MRSVQFFRDKEATFLIPLGIKSHLEYWGVASKNIVELDWWAEHEFDESALYAHQLNTSLDEREPIKQPSGHRG